MLNDFNPFNENIELQYFVGREAQLKQFRADLSGLKAKVPNHQYIAGENGTGKTTYLAKLVEIAETEGFMAVMPTLDAADLPGKDMSRVHIETIILSIITGLQERLQGDIQLVNDWQKKGNSQYFQQPKTEELTSDLIRQDFKTIEKFMVDAKLLGIVICIDEGQRIDGRAMSALKNSLQHLKSYLLVLSLRTIKHTIGPIKVGRNMLDLKAAGEKGEGDIGASRFYVTGIAIGPFDTEQEATQCIKRRLVDNVIQFDNDVITRLGRITGRTPKFIISLANEVYGEAQRNSEQLVKVTLLNQTFRKVYHKETIEAQSLVASASEATRSALRSLLEIGQGVSAEAVTSHIYPGVAPEMLPYLVTGVRGELERLCNLSSFCVRQEDCFEIPEPVHAYALELALGIV